MHVTLKREIIEVLLNTSGYNVDTFYIILNIFTACGGSWFLAFTWLMYFAYLDKIHIN